MFRFHAWVQKCHFGKNATNFLKTRLKVIESQIKMISLERILSTKVRPSGHANERTFIFTAENFSIELRFPAEDWFIYLTFFLLSR